MEKINEIDRLVSEGKLEEAIAELGRMIAARISRETETEEQPAVCQVTDGDKELAQLYFRRGKLYWRLSRRGEAQSDYARAAALDPQSPAQVALRQAREVESFFNPDLYNP